MYKLTALITWQEHVPEDARTALMERASALITATYKVISLGLPSASWRGGDRVWHLLFADRAAWEASEAAAALDLIEADEGVAALEAVAYPVIRRGLGHAGLEDGVYRTLFIAVEPHADQAQRREFVEDLAQMPHHIPQILNWGLNEIIASRGEKRWTHVWEQEFARVEDLTGPYLNAPYHVFHVDRWFDGEMPCCIIAADGIRHSASTITQSVIGRT
jgi:hypothetical protein